MVLGFIKKKTVSPADQTLTADVPDNNQVHLPDDVSAEQTSCTEMTAGGTGDMSLTANPTISHSDPAEEEKAAEQAETSEESADKEVSHDESSAMKKQEMAAGGGEQSNIIMKKPAAKEEQPPVYENYEHQSYGSVQVFAARQKGRGHEYENKPCQDYCLHAETTKGIILAAADGLGSCAKSDIGSKLACETAVEIIKEADARCADEKTFIELLTSAILMKNLVNKWIRRISDDIENTPGIALEDRKAIRKQYNTTLLFSVITENYYVGVNLGDGQIQFFDEDKAVRVRTHKEKESTATDALLDSRGYMEETITAVYPRSLFAGILLTTDGIYDALPGLPLHIYAKQLMTRFLAEGEPKDPFVYRRENGKYSNIQKNGLSRDDCTIILAADINPRQEDTITSHIREISEVEMIERMTADVRKYIVSNAGELSDIIVSKDPVFKDELDGAVFMETVNSEEIGGMCYSEYKRTSLSSVEDLYCQGSLNAANRTFADLDGILRLYKKLHDLSFKLNEKGYAFNESARFLTLYDNDENMLIYREAISRKDEVKNPDVFSVYFESLMGILSCDQKEYPVFMPGYTNAANIMNRFDERSHEKLCYVIRSEKDYKLVNISGARWIMSDGKVVENKKTVLLEDGMSFFVEDGNGIYVRYTYAKR